MPQDPETQKIFTEKCKKGLHPFDDILATGPEQEITVVRWCPIRGTVSIDIDCDGRTHPGAVSIARRPQILELDE